jgi:hypothetical protein
MGPLPLWARPSPVGLRLQDKARAGQPAILRFDHDEFVQEYIDTLHNEPERLGEWIAQPETWRDPMLSPKRAQPESQQTSRVAFLYDQTRRLTAAKKPALPTAVTFQGLKNQLKKKPLATVSATSDEQLPLKLYQAGQKRHYLVSTSLICEEPGLPDCEPELARREKVSFVMRRLLPPDEDATTTLEEWDEYAFVPGPRSNSWRRIGSHSSVVVRALVSGEEQLPMFPITYQNSCGQSRRLLSGTIPVSRREQWVGAELGADTDNASGATVANASRSLASLLFHTDVVAPWKILLEQAELKKTAADKDFVNFGSNASAQAEERKRLLRTARDELQTGSWYVLFDFAGFLQGRLPDIWQVLKGDKAFDSLNDVEQALVNVLTGTTMAWQLGWEIVTYPFFPFFGFPGFGVTPQANANRYSLLHLKWTLADALVAAEAAGQGLEAVETIFTRFDESGNILVLDNNWPDFLFPLADPDRDAPTPAVAVSELTGLTGLEKEQTAVDVLAEMVERLLPAAEAADELIDSVPPGDSRTAWFVVRCVYDRPDCGPLFPPLVSAATRKFQMAPFFDPDAPARPVRIPMPVDISPAGLRKYQKNTGFVISDMLCGKIKGIRKMTFADLVLSVLPWPFHKDLPDLGKSGPCNDGSNSFGMICSLSIPIVTLCALVLMMIMVALFDLFFRWIPYLFVCLPIPGLKGKAKS